MSYPIRGTLRVKLTRSILASLLIIIKFEVEKCSVNDKPEMEVNRRKTSTLLYKKRTQRDRELLFDRLTKELNN